MDELGRCIFGGRGCGRFSDVGSCIARFEAVGHGIGDFKSPWDLGRG